MASQHACEGPIRKWRPRASTTSTGMFQYVLVCTYLDVKARGLQPGLQSTIKTPCGLSSLFQACTVRHRALGCCNILPLLPIEEALQKQRAARFSNMSFFCLYLLYFLYLKSYLPRQRNGKQSPFRVFQCF